MTVSTTAELLDRIRLTRRTGARCAPPCRTCAPAQPAARFQRPLDDRRAFPVPPDVDQACRDLGWTLLAVGQYGGETGYLVQANGITEPYSAQAILDAAQEQLPALQPPSPIPMGEGQPTASVGGVGAQ